MTICEKCGEEKKHIPVEHCIYCGEWEPILEDIQRMQRECFMLFLYVSVVLSVTGLVLLIVRLLQ